MKSFVTSALTGFAIGLGILAMLTLTGCAAKQPNLIRPSAQLVIPVACIDGVTGGVKGVLCEALPKKSANEPDYALCRGGVIIKYHCSKVAAN